MGHPRALQAFFALRSIWGEAPGWGLLCCIPSAPHFSGESFLSSLMLPGEGGGLDASLAIRLAWDPRKAVWTGLVEGRMCRGEWGMTPPPAAPFPFLSLEATRPRI